MDFSALKKIDLQKLKDIDLKNIDLNELKNIDADQVKQFLKRYLDIAVNITAGLLTIIICFQIFGNYSKNMKSVKSKINTEQALLTVVDQNKSYLKTFTDLTKEFKIFLPGDEILTEISNIAVNTHVQIEKLTPHKEKRTTLLQISYLDLQISSFNYEDVIAFTKNIELLDKSIRIETWSATSKTVQETLQKGPQTKNKRNQKTQKTKTREKILLQLTLSSVNIRNEK